MYGLWVPKVIYIVSNILTSLYRKYSAPLWGDLS